VKFLTICFILKIIKAKISERLHLKNVEISQALEEKHKIIAEILQIPFEDLKNLTRDVAISTKDGDAKKVLLATMIEGLKVVFYLSI